MDPMDLKSLALILAALLALRVISLALVPGALRIETHFHRQRHSGHRH